MKDKIIEILKEFYDDLDHDCYLSGDKSLEDYAQEIEDAINTLYYEEGNPRVSRIIIPPDFVYTRGTPEEIAKRVIEEFIGNYSGKHTYIDVKILFDYLDNRRE